MNDQDIPIPTSIPPPIIQPPALWNPNAAANWSLLFSPAFGAYLHARNAETLGRQDEAKINKVWFYSYIAYLFVGMVACFLPIIPDWVTGPMISFVLLVIWYSHVGRNQILYVKKTWNDGYVRKPWKKPLLIAFGCVFGLIGLLVIIGIILDATGIVVV